MCWRILLIFCSLMCLLACTFYLYFFQYLVVSKNKYFFVLFPTGLTVPGPSAPCEHIHQLNQTTPSGSCHPNNTIHHTQHTALYDQSIVVCTAEDVNCVEEHV